MFGEFQVQIFLWGGVCIFALFFLFILIFLYKNKRSKQNKLQKFRKKIKKIYIQISQLPDIQNNQKILEYDKLLDAVLKFKNLQGTTGEKMKEAGNKKLFISEKNIWYAHKQRNKIAHEVGFILSKSEFEKCKKYYKKEIFNCVR